MVFLAAPKLGRLVSAHHLLRAPRTLDFEATIPVSICAMRNPPSLGIQHACKRSSAGGIGVILDISELVNDECINRGG